MGRGLGQVQAGAAAGEDELVVRLGEHLVQGGEDLGQGGVDGRERISLTVDLLVGEGTVFLFHGLNSFSLMGGGRQRKAAA